MSFKLQQIDAKSKLIQHMHIDILERFYPRQVVGDLLSQCGAWEKRERKLSQLIIVYYIMGLWLFRSLNQKEVFGRMASRLHWLWPDLHLRLPGAPALLYRRQQLAVTVLRLLFRRCCRPLSTAGTPGAFRFGLRLMALDSTVEDVADTPANALHFGRIVSGPSASPFPQMRCLYLAEVGTHVLVDAVPAPCAKSEQSLAPTLLRSIEKGMLVLMDRNFPSTDWINSVRGNQAHLLARLATTRFTAVDRVLSDGSTLHTLHPSHGPAFQVRVITYRLTPQMVNDLTPLPGSRNSAPSNPGQVHRLVTTLLDPKQAPAIDLILCYHERWEIEEIIGETKTSLRFTQDPMRSQDPVLVYQEFYGLLLAHYAVRAWMFESATAADLDTDRLSFTHALEVLHQACAQSPVMAHELAHFTQRILFDLREPSSLLRPRRLRFYPRVLKRAQASFIRKRPHHEGFELKNTSFREILLI
jgi:Insertion element 4 transposase N-terminal/Transposase DDE domain